MNEVRIVAAMRRKGCIPPLEILAKRGWRRKKRSFLGGIRDVASIFRLTLSGASRVANYYGISWL